MFELPPAQGGPVATPLKMQCETAAAGPTVAGHIFESQRAATVNAFVGHESLHGARQFKVVTGAVVGRVWRLLCKGPPNVGHV